MKPQPDTSPPASREKDERLPYEKPAIIFETTITTRAGSPLQTPHNPTFDVDEFLKWLGQ